MKIMACYAPQTIAQLAVEAGVRKSQLPWLAKMLLGFCGGAYIAFGFLLDIRVVADLPPAWGMFAQLLGAAVFPIGLMLILVGGGELITGNMMVLPIAWLAKRISFASVLSCFFWVTVANVLGAVFVAYFFGHIVGLTEADDTLRTTVQFAHDRLDVSFGRDFASGIGCNWLVTLAVWLAFGVQKVAAKLLCIWFPILAFVAIGFQQVVANLFVIPAAVFAGQATWWACLTNAVPVYLGNIVGGALFVAALYYKVYLHGKQHTRDRDESGGEK